MKSNVGLQVMPIDELIERVASVCKRCGAEHLDLFGSFATELPLPEVILILSYTVMWIVNF